MKKFQSLTRFNLKTFFYFITFYAIAFSVIANLGFFGFIFYFILPIAIVTAALLSIPAKREMPYCRCIGSLIIVWYLCQPVNAMVPTVPEIVVFASLLGIGSMLAISSLWRGHWSTRILACFSLAVYSLFYNYVARETISDWNIIVRYWSM